MTVPPPLVEPRDIAQFVRDTRAAIRTALDLPVPLDGLDTPVPGDSLVHIFARLAEIVAKRINGVPEKNLLAFLSLLGLDQRPPRPARVALTFQLAKGATGALVPAGTTVAATAAEGEITPPTYETERALVATATLLVAAFTREPAHDRYRDATSVLAADPVPVPVFEGDTPIGHALYVGDRLLALAQPKRVTLSLDTSPAANVAWPAALAWSAFDGAAWQPLAAQAKQDAPSVWSITFSGLEGVAATAVGDSSQPWLRALLSTPLAHDGAPPPPDGELEQRGLAPDRAFADDQELDPRGALAPFGVKIARTTFSIACERAFTKPGAQVTLDVDVDTSVPAIPSSALTLTWQTWDGTAWSTLGTSSPRPAGGAQGAARFADATGALTRSGKISFLAPAGWADSEVGAVRARWLRAVVTAGSFGTPPAYAAPALRRISISYSWPQPQVAALTRAVTIARKALAPDAVLIGDTPLDITKDFLPLGEQPRFNDAFYVAFDEALSLPNATITLRINGTRQLAASLSPELTWEVYDAALARWQPSATQKPALTFAGKGKAAGTKAGESVVLTTTSSPGPIELAGRLRHCVRARLTDGDYGGPAGFVALPDGKGFAPTPATWTPPSIASIAIEYQFTSGQQPPGAVATVNDFTVRRPDPAGAFAPFTVTADDVPTLHVGAGGDFDNATTMLFLDVEDSAYEPGSDRSAPLPEPPVVAWEYLGAAGWQPLGTRDESGGFSRRGVLTFVAPADMVRASQFGIDAYWLRARWTRGGYRVPPRLKRILTNTVWASNVTTVRDELLGSSTGEPGQTMRAANAPILPGERIEVRERGVPSTPELLDLVAEQGDGAVRLAPPTPARASETWVRWHPVTDFYASGPRSRHYVVDRLTGELRFGDGRRGLAPPAGRANVRAAVYPTGGGSAGNRPAGTITQLRTAVPSVSGVTNLAAAAGGEDAESIEGVRERGPRTLRHRDRAVTIGDVEDLALEASTSIARVLGVPATDAGDAGQVGVVVVPESDAPQPVPSLELLDAVRAYVERRLALGSSLWVAGPGWLRVDVRVEVVPLSLDTATDVEHAVHARLRRFLHPLHGGPHGASWAFGRAPRRSDLIALVEDVPGVEYVRGLSLDTTVTAPEPARGATLLFAGDLLVTIAGETDDEAS